MEIEEEVHRLEIQIQAVVVVPAFWTAFATVDYSMKTTDMDKDKDKDRTNQRLQSAVLVQAVRYSYQFLHRSSKFLQ